MLGEGLRGPSANCRLCQVGCQGGRGRDSVAGLPPGSRHSEPAGQPCGSSPLPLVLCAWDGPGRGLCPVTEPPSCAVSVTLGSGVCDAPAGLGVKVLSCQVRLSLEALWAPLFQLCQAPVHMGAQADSARLELLASSPSRPTCCRRGWAVFFPFFPFLGCDSSGMSVGSDRTPVRGLDQGVPQSQAVPPLAPEWGAGCEPGDTVTNGNGLTPLDLGRIWSGALEAFKLETDVI